MEDSTPGSTENQTQGVEQTSLETTQQQSADAGQQATSVDTQSSATDTPQVGNDTTNANGGSQASSQVDEVSDWAKKQGYDLENLTADQAKTLAKRVIDNQKAYHEANSRLKAAENFSTETSEVYDQEEQNPVISEANKALAAIRTERFFNQNPGAEEYSGKMVELITKERETYGDDAARILANNLPRLYTLAKAEMAAQDASAEYDKGRQDERRNLAQSQQAAGPAMSANSGAPQSTNVTDKQIGEMSTAEYMEWRKTNNPWAL